MVSYTKKEFIAKCDGLFISSTTLLGKFKITFLDGDVVEMPIRFVKQGSKLNLGSIKLNEKHIRVIEPIRNDWYFNP